MAELTLDASGATQARDTKRFFARQSRIERFESKRIVSVVEMLVLAALPERLSEGFFATTVNADRARINQAFLDVRGVKLHAGLRRLRVEELRRRVEADATLSLRTALRQCGFGHFSHVRRLFRDCFGVPFDEFYVTLLANRSRQNESLSPEDTIRQERTQSNIVIQRMKSRRASLPVPSRLEESLQTSARMRQTSSRKATHMHH